MKTAKKIGLGIGNPKRYSGKQALTLELMDISFAVIEEEIYSEMMKAGLTEAEVECFNADISYHDGNPVVAGFRLLPVFFVMVGLIYVSICNMFTGGIAKKTMNQNCEKENFGESSTFITDG